MSNYLKKHKSKKLYSIREAWEDSIVVFDKSDFNTNYSELIISQFFSSFFNHKYKSKKTLSQVIRSGGLYQDRIMEEKPRIPNVSNLDYKFNCPIIFLKKEDFDIELSKYDSIKKKFNRCHLLSQNVYQSISSRIFQDIKNLNKQSLSKIILLLWVTEKSTIFSYSDSYPQQIIRNNVLDLNSNLSFKKEIIESVENNYDIFFKKYDNTTQTNTIHKMKFEEFINFRNNINNIKNDIENASVPFKDIFDKYDSELSVVSNSFHSYVTSYKDFLDLSLFIRNDIKHHLNNMNNYANLI